MLGDSIVEMMSFMESMKSMEFHGIQWIPWKSMESVEIHGIYGNPLNSMETHVIYGNPWSSIHPGQVLFFGETVKKHAFGDNSFLSWIWVGGGRGWSNST